MSHLKVVDVAVAVAVTCVVAAAAAVFNWRLAGPDYGVAFAVSAIAFSLGRVLWEQSRGK